MTTPNPLKKPIDPAASLRTAVLAKLQRVPKKVVK